MSNSTKQSTAQMLSKMKTDASSDRSEEEAKACARSNPAILVSAPTTEQDKPELVMKNLVENCLAPTMGKPKLQPQNS